MPFFLFLAMYAVHAGYLFVTDALPTISTIKEPPSVVCKDFYDQIKFMIS